MGADRRYARLEAGEPALALWQGPGHVLVDENDVCTAPMPPEALGMPLAEAFVDEPGGRELFVLMDRVYRTGGRAFLSIGRGDITLSRVPAPSGGWGVATSYRVTRPTLPRPRPQRVSLASIHST